MCVFASMIEIVLCIVPVAKAARNSTDVKNDALMVANVPVYNPCDDAQGW